MNTTGKSGFLFASRRKHKKLPLEARLEIAMYICENPYARIKEIAYRFNVTLSLVSRIETKYVIIEKKPRGFVIDLLGTPVPDPEE